MVGQEINRDFISFENKREHYICPGADGKRGDFDHRQGAQEE